jgi:site-specific DNA-methyltransferase (adenine-specific)
MIETNYNPDVLTCLANLSNDEVFTPPNLANQMLDILPQELFSNSKTTFLDPVCKSGVFLREIAKRLMKGLETEFPNQQERLNHIFSKQLFGIAITELTSLLSRRSVYCSKIANGKYSICETFTNEQGNIIFDKTEHDWKNGKCTFCNASQEVYDREDALETYAYQFIHTNNPEKIFKNMAHSQNAAFHHKKTNKTDEMKFDVIIGNPPYQLSDGGAQSSASPIYHKFIQQAKKLNPTYLSMIVPARWYAGGKGLDEFRAEMLNDERLAEIHDFPETSDCFAGINIRGGVCYFLWDKTHKGDCKITNYKNGTASKTIERPLLEKSSDIFVRYNDAISILRKVQNFKEESFSKFVSSRKPFGLATNFSSFSAKETKDKSIFLHRFGDNGFISEKQIERNKEWVNQFKIIVPKASPGSDIYPHQILSKPIIAGKNTCCTETYIVVGPFATEKKSKSVQAYMNTQFFRFMILLMKNTQDVTKKVYSFVPIQNFDEPWTDEKLYKKYGINKEEIAFIDSMVRPMILEK